MPLKNMNLPKLIDNFHDEDKARELLEELRWPNGPVCPRCGSTEASAVKDRPTWSCRSCRKQFSVRVGTVLEDSKLPLWKWFLATYLMIEAKKGVSSNQLKRTLGVSYKSAWFLTHRIRAAMGSLVEEKLWGVIEVDETFVGGKPRNPRRRPDGRAIPGMDPNNPKTIVLGAVVRGGDVRLRISPDRHSISLREFIEDKIADDAPAIFTDDWPGYKKIIADEDTIHESVNHSRKEWVRGDVHTNTVEGVWSLLKRSIIGSYHHLSVKHLPAYLDELEWRFNNRNNPYLFRDTLKALVANETLEYAELIAD